MRRVVVTGMGIVSSIGNNTAGSAGLAARGASPASCAPTNTPSSASAARCTARPTLDPARPGRPPRHALPRRRRRPGTTSPWSRRSRDAGLEDERHLQRAHRHHHGLRRPLDPHHRRGRRHHPRARARSASARSRCPRRCRSTASATLATWFKIKGVNYSISSACATSTHCIGNAVRDDPVRQAGHDVRRRLRGARLDAVGPVRRHGRDVDQVQRHARRRPRAPTTPTATASSSPAAPASWCSRSSSTPRRAAPRSTPRSPATAPPPTATTWWRRRARARCAACSMALDTRQARRSTTSTRTPPRRRSATSRRSRRSARCSATKCPPISATKSLTGHSLGAAGVQEAIYSLLMMQQRLHLRERQHRRARPGLRRHADRARAPRRRAARHACCPIRFGFGGTNASLVFQRYAG